MAHLKVSEDAITLGQGAKRRLDIQGLRGVSVLAVVAYHAGLPVGGGFIGVDVFFVISGYVIAMSVAARRNREGHFAFWTFMWHRYRRLAPALGVMVLPVALGVLVLASPLGSFQYNAQAGIASLLYLSNIWFSRAIGDYFAQSAQFNAFLNTWSLSVEEQFYLLFALGLVIFTRLTARLRVIAVGLVVTALAASLLVSFIGAPELFPTSGHLVGFFSPVSRAWEFLIGVVAYTAFRKLRLRSGHARLATLVALVVLFWCLLFMPDDVRWPGPITVIPVLATAVILVVGNTDRSSAAGVLVLESPAITWVGDRSYSIYLWHWPLLVLVTIYLDLGLLGILGAIIAAVVLGHLSFRLVEQRWRTTAWSLKGFSRLLAFFTVGPVLVLLVLQLLAPKLVQQVRPMESQLGTRSLGLQDCLVSVSSEEGLKDLVKRCTFGPSFDGKPVYLVGDSQAAHFAEGFMAAGEELARPVSVLTAPSCPHIDVFLSSSRGDEALTEQCRRHFEIVHHFLRNAPQGTVVIAASPGYWLRRDIAVAQSPPKWFRERSAMQQALFDGLESTAKQLSDQGHEVVLLEPLPQFVPPGPTISPIDCSLLEMLTRQCTFRSEVNQIPEEQVEVTHKFRDLVNSPRVRTSDLQNQVCPEGLCDFYGGGIPLYSDNTHLSSEFSRELGSRFVELLGQPE